MQYYCTLFNTSYLSRAMVMYDSLEKTGAPFHLYIFAFDDTVHTFFTSQGAKKNITVISLAEFQDDDLLRIKPTRTVAEYCWTCTPSAILYSIQKFNLPACTYIDADLFFFSDPGVLIDEMREHSVLLTEHRFTKEYEKDDENGIYCVQFMTFKNDSNGMKALTWWRNACIEWCYARAENGKFGDQKYLDDWLVRFEGVHILKHLGGGVAPWNVQQYDFFLFGENVYGAERTTGTVFPIVFFHFHSFKFFTDNTISLSFYPTPVSAFELIYQPYINKLIQKRVELEKHLPGLDTEGRGVKPVAKHSLSALIQYYWQDIKTVGRYLAGKNIRERNKPANAYPLDTFKK